VAHNAARRTVLLKRLAATPGQGRTRTTTLGGKLSVPKPVNLPSIKKARPQTNAQSEG
jgi:hypothetical protein